MAPAGAKISGPETNLRDAQARFSQWGVIHVVSLSFASRLVPVAERKRCRRPTRLGIGRCVGNCALMDGPVFVVSRSPGAREQLGYLILSRQERAWAMSV